MISFPSGLYFKCPLFGIFLTSAFDCEMCCVFLGLGELLYDPQYFPSCIIVIFGACISELRADALNVSYILRLVEFQHNQMNQCACSRLSGPPACPCVALCSLGFQLQYFSGLAWFCESTDCGCKSSVWGFVVDQNRANRLIINLSSCRSTQSL